MDAKKCDICGKFYEEKPVSLVQEFEDAFNELLPFVTSKDILNRFKRLTDAILETIQAGIGIIKSEAIKEFAERVKRHIDVGHLRSPTEICFSELAVVNMIDYLVKEMVGESNV